MTSSPRETDRRPPPPPTATATTTTTSEDDLFGIKQEILNAPRPRPGHTSNIAEFYRDRSVLITGASGFIGKVLIEKLLRTCPSIRRIFVLIRPKWSQRPEERLKELLNSHLFHGHGDLTDRVVVLEGDVAQQNLGLSSYNLSRVTKEVSVVFHSAATVKFDEPLRQSIAINIAGTKNIIKLCRRCPKLAALVHVSTAYANCDRESVAEHVYPLDMDPEKLIELADWLDQDTLQELKKRLLGARPNTYTYTKALAEWLIVKSARDLPVVICRPSIVVASSSEPFKGWIDNVNGPTGVVLGAGKGLVRSMFAETECVADLVPVDRVINLMVTLGWFACINKNRKRLNDSVAESFTDSLVGSGGSGSSAAGSSAASISGGEDSQEDHEPDHCGDEMLLMASGETSLASEISSQSNETAPPSSASSDVAEDDNNNNNNNNSSSSNNNSNNKGSEDSYECSRHQHHNHIHNHLDSVAAAASEHLTRHHQHDDGYGSRSSDYANSIVSTSSDSATSSLTRRPRRSVYSKSHDADKQQQQQKQQLPGLITSIRESAVPNELTTNSSSSSNNNNNSDVTKDLCDMQRKQHETLADNNNESSTANDEIDYKLRVFRQRTRAKLMEKGLPEELADVPVFHCTSGSENPITWGQVQIFIVAALAIFPSSLTYRYPCGAFTNNERLDNFYRLTLHYIPGYIVDFITRLLGGKPIIVRMFNKFDQAASVLKEFTSKEWHFEDDNRLFLIDELMTDEDRRLFNCDIKSLDWQEFCRDYAAGVRKFLLKEPVSSLAQARKNLKFVYYRNLGLQLTFLATSAYCMAMCLPTIWSF